MKRVVLLSAVIFMAFLLPAQQEYQSCSEPYFVCSNMPVLIEKLPAKKNENTFLKLDCFEGSFSLTNSIWFKWKVKHGGELGFTLMPLDNNDDIDFVLFKITDNLEVCESMKPVRCMASGENRGRYKFDVKSNCSGATGLSGVSNDKSEFSGCDVSDDNFLEKVQVFEGEEYMLLVNNYYSFNGFFLEFDGDVQFDAISEECKSMEVGENFSVSLNGIVDSGLFFDPIYPNPSGSKINLMISSEEIYYSENSNYQIIDLYGRILEYGGLSVVLGANKLNIDVAALPIGVYYLKVVIGENIHIARFVKV